MVLLFFSCQKEEYQFQKEIIGHEINKNLGDVHPSILQSDWWKQQPDFEKEILKIELASEDNQITFEELQKRFTQALRNAEKDGMRASVCPGYPSPNPEGHVDLCTQADVDAIGALGCKKISGRLRIFDTLGVDPICDLTPLHNITKIGSALNIQAGSCLTSLDGLDNIKSIGKSGPFGFVGVNGPALTDIEALANVKKITGSINIIGCDNLVSFTNAFENITSIDSSYVPSSSFVSQYVLNIDNNASLVDISGFRNLTNIDRILYIRNNASLQNIDDLSALSGNLLFLIVNNNGSLENLDGLSGLTTLSGSIFLFDNPLLQNVDGLSGVTSVALNVFLQNNPLLSDCCGLYNLVCNDPPACSTSGIGNIFFSDGCQEVDIIAGGPCL